MQSAGSYVVVVEVPELKLPLRRRTEIALRLARCLLLRRTLPLRSRLLLHMLPSTPLCFLKLPAADQ